MWRWLRASLLVLGILACLAVALEIYARIPAGFDVRPLEPGNGVRRIVLIFHGRGGAEEPAIGALAARFAALAAGQPDFAVVRYVWAPHSETRFRSAVNGARVGAVLGQQLAGLPGLEYVHVIGHSAGAYLLDPLCEALRVGGGRDVRIEMTFLDPIGFAGAFDVGYGARNFGRCADYAEAYINTDDPAPATRAPLRHAWNLDVTHAPERANYGGGGHRWPVQYYLDRLTATGLAAVERDHGTRPRGAVEQH